MNFKNLGICSALVATIIFTGCAQKDVELDSSANNQQTPQYETSESKLDNIETVNMDESQNSMNDMDHESMMNGNYVMLNGEKIMLENVYFGFDKFSITDNMRSVIKSNSSKLSGVTSEKIKLEGNCDEWGSDEYNYALGLKRAKATKDAMVENGIPSDSITLISYGESNPTCSESSKDCWSQNRRVEFKVLP